jgi:hypothetical protein
MSYDVGQVLYTIIKDKQVIIPVRVVEQIVVKDLDGETINYKVLLPNQKNQKVDIEKLENVFLDLDEVSDYILKRTKESVDRMVEDAISLEDTFFIDDKKNKIDENFKCKNELNSDNIKSDQIQINLENGQVANVIDNSNILGKEAVEKIKKVKEENESSST